MMQTRVLYLLIPVFAAVVLTSTSLFLKSKMPQDINKIEAISGSHFCSDGGIVDIALVGNMNAVRSGLLMGGPHGPRKSDAEIRRALLANFPSNQTPCIDLGLWPEELYQTEPYRLKKNTGYVSIGNQKIPLIMTRFENNEIRGKKFNGKIIIRLSGGPGAIPIGATRDVATRLSKNDLIIDFIYTGSGTNLVYPEPNFDAAVSQVHYFVKSIRRLNPGAEIVLVGESLGAAVALASLEKKTLQAEAPLVDKIILISPGASSMRSFIEVSEKGSRQVEPSTLLEIYRTLETENDDWSTRTIKQLNRIDVLRNFFPDNALNDTISDRASKISSVPILVIYGNRDPIIGLKEIEALKSNKSVTLVEIDKMQHDISNLGHLSEMHYAIESFLY